MTVREMAKALHFEPVGKLRRIKDVYYGMDNQHHDPCYIDEAGNEFCMSSDGVTPGCIVTAAGGVI